MLRRSLIVALVLGSISLPAQAANVLSNAGFESGLLAPWTINTGTPVVTSDQAHSGTYSVAELGGDEIKQTFGPIATSDISEVSLWAMRPQGGVLDLYTFYYSDNTSAFFLISDGAASGWTQYSLTSNLAAGKNLVGFSIFGTSPGPAYLDDFVINAGGAVPEPSTWAMMLFGFGMIGFALRGRARTVTA